MGELIHLIIIILRIAVVKDEHIQKLGEDRKDHPPID